MYLKFQSTSLNGDEVHKPFLSHKSNKNWYYRLCPTSNHIYLRRTDWSSFSQQYFSHSFVLHSHLYWPTKVLRTWITNKLNNCYCWWQATTYFLGILIWLKDFSSLWRSYIHHDLLCSQHFLPKPGVLMISCKEIEEQPSSFPDAVDLKLAPLSHKMYN